MQYETPLPDNFDMEQVRQRVRQASPSFDHYEGLHFKLYGVNDRMQTPLNEYSSIYLWSSVGPMRGFLVGDLFDNYAQAFARPSVKSWIAQVVRGDVGALSSGRFALRQTFGIPRRAKVSDFLETRIEQNVCPAALLQVTGLDASSWEAIDLTVWREMPELKQSINGHLYHLIHVSLP
jgi:uncharacterized protein DUF4865